MNANQKEGFKELFTTFQATIKGDLEKQAHKTRTRLDSKNMIDQKAATTHDFKPEIFDGNPVAVASV